MKIEVSEFYRAILDIAVERKAQDEQWGGQKHDDAHDPRDWVHFINKQTLSAYYEYFNPRAYESRMVKIAALAIAAIESSRRGRFTEPPDTAPINPADYCPPVCRWCDEGKPEWSEHTKSWIHRRERLDKKCLNPGRWVAERPDKADAPTGGRVVEEKESAPCQECGGSGVITASTWHYKYRSECPTCKGTGVEKA